VEKKAAYLMSDRKQSESFSLSEIVTAGEGTVSVGGM
jgi:hypothetical protein